MDTSLDNKTGSGRIANALDRHVALVSKRLPYGNNGNSPDHSWIKADVLH
jgi:hypothetical protein